MVASKPMDILFRIEETAHFLVSTTTREKLSTSAFAYSCKFQQINRNMLVSLIATYCSVKVGAFSPLKAATTHKNFKLTKNTMSLILEGFFKFLFLCICVWVNKKMSLHVAENVDCAVFLSPHLWQKKLFFYELVVSTFLDASLKMCKFNS